MVQTTLLDRLAELDEIWPGDEQRPHPIPSVSLRSPTTGRLRAFAAGHRWGLIAAAVLAALAAWLLLVVAPSVGERAAADLQASLDAGLDGLEQALPGASSALATTTDPAATSDELSDAIATLAPLSGSASRLALLASEPLPSTPPLVPRDQLESLVPSRAAAGAVAADAEQIAIRLDRFIAYRLAFDGAVSLPPLPGEAGPDEIDLLSTELAVSIAGSVETIVSLPADPLLDSHRAEANGLLTELEDFRTAYLASLRSGDPGEGDRLVGVIEGRIQTVEASLAVSLADVEEWWVTQLDALRRSLRDARP